MRFILSAAGYLILAFALVFAVSDIARSLAGDIVRFTPLDQALDVAGLGGDVVTPSSSALDVWAVVSSWPASITLGVTAFVLLFLGRRRAARITR